MPVAPAARHQSSPPALPGRPEPLAPLSHRRATRLTGRTPSWRSVRRPRTGGSSAVGRSPAASLARAKVRRTSCPPTGCARFPWASAMPTPPAASRRAHPRRARGTRRFRSVALLDALLTRATLMSAVSFAPPPLPAGAGVSGNVPGMATVTLDPKGNNSGQRLRAKGGLCRSFTRTGRPAAPSGESPIVVKPVPDVTIAAVGPWTLFCQQAGACPDPSLRKPWQALGGRTARLPRTHALRGPTRGWPRPLHGEFGEDRTRQTLARRCVHGIRFLRSVQFSTGVRCSLALYEGGPVVKG